jgi:uncharacterized protein
MLWMKRIVLALAGAAMVAYLGIAAMLYAQQRSLLFRPDTTRIAPADAGFARAREVSLNPEGRPLLLGWHVRPTYASRPVFLYLHGNAANLARRAGRFDTLTRGGEGLLALSWRGYGGSEGEPSEAGFHEDVASALAFLQREGVEPGRIILFGESLGSGMAVMTAARVPVKGLILDSAYSSIAGIAAARYWWLPVELLLKDAFRADAAAPLVTAATLAIHCRDDWVTPYAGGKALLAKLTAPHRLVTVERACHVPPLADGGGDAIRDFVAALEKRN